jgi:hypothetical protein
MTVSQPKLFRMIFWWAESDFQSPASFAQIRAIASRWARSATVVSTCFA